MRPPLTTYVQKLKFMRWQHYKNQTRKDQPGSTFEHSIDRREIFKYKHTNTHFYASLD